MESTNNQKSKKRERFERIASSRVNTILDTLDSLSKCSNKNNYEYTEQDVKKMFETIKDRIKTTEKLFHEEANKKEKNEFHF